MVGGARLVLAHMKQRKTDYRNRPILTEDTSRPREGKFRFQSRAFTLRFYHRGERLALRSNTIFFHVDLAI